jgi:hypothetical protein
MQADVARSLKTTPDDELQERPGQAVGIEAKIPHRERIKARPFHPDIAAGPHLDRTGILDVIRKAREELCEAYLARTKQGVPVPCLWRARPWLRSTGERVAIQDRDPIEIIGSRLGSCQSCYTRSNDNSVFTQQFRH